MSASLSTLALEPAPVGRASRSPRAASRVAVVARQGGTRVAVGVRDRAAAARARSTPALNAVNVHDPAALTAAIRAALDKLAPRPRRVALVLPDTVAKVSLLRFEKVPAKAQDLDQLIRWQMRKAAPFKIEDAQIVLGPGGADRRAAAASIVVTLARRDIVESYERACDAAGVARRASSIWPAST